MSATEIPAALRIGSGPPPSDAGNPEEDPRTFRALGSAVRMRILSSIATREKSIAELARELRFHPVTLRYHLGYLRNQGLIEEIVPSGPRAVGRPATLYRALKHLRVAGFPQRRFDLLGQIALDALVEAVGKDAASRHLRSRGRAIGRSMIESLAAKVKVGRWTIDAFERFVLNGLFREFGIPTELVRKSSTGLVYRAFGCPFLEVAEKMPELVCNSLDLGFHQGIDDALDGVRTERLACMGHGDPYCEYRLTWNGKAARSPSRKRSEHERRTGAVINRVRVGRSN